jgi:radical SAM superfamily enzyme YgiQ (UPF0313 family)
MKILLVLPAADAVRVTRENPRVPRRRMLRFSVLPLTTVAALTPPRHEVRLVDENVEPLDLDADVDLVGVSFMTALAPRAYALADAFRRRGIPTVAGGYHPTFLPLEALDHFDAVVVGEAEGNWPRLLEDLEAGRLSRVYRTEGPCDPATIPIPRRDLTAKTARHYATVHAVQAGRGCVHACAYCSVTAFHGGRHRSRPVASVLAELDGLPRDFMFVDDNLIADPAWARLLFTAMAPMGKRWVAQAPLEIVDDPELLELARKAGCLGLFVGIETLSEENLLAVEKGFNDAGSYRRRVAALRRAGIGIIAGVIVGLDGDDRGTFERLLRFLRLASIDAVQVNVLTPLPGTKLHDRFDRDGRILSKDWSLYDYRHVVIEPRRMSAEDLQAGADWLCAAFYRLDRIALRFVRALFTLGPAGAWLGLKLGLTYRYDVRRNGIVGWNPARRPVIAGIAGSEVPSWPVS